MSHSPNCLNCQSKVENQYCSYCGQKTDIHRINFKHFISHDLMHGLFHLEKGMLFTAKEVLTRPGNAALDYIEGKRIRYYNVFYFILIIIGLNLFLNGYYDKLHEMNSIKTPIKTIGEANKFLDFIKNNAKTILFSFVPLLAINSFLLFRKRKLNLSEHFIIAAFTYLGILLISTTDTLLSFFTFVKHIDFIAAVSNFLTPFAIMSLVVLSYYQAFKKFYKKSSFVLRMFLFGTFLLFEIVFFIILIIGYTTNWMTSDFNFHL